MMATVQTAMPALANDLPVAGSWWGQPTQRPFETQSCSETLPVESGRSIDMNQSTHSSARAIPHGGSGKHG